MTIFPLRGAEGDGGNKCLEFKTRVVPSRGLRVFATLDRVIYWWLWAMTLLLIIPCHLPYNWGNHEIPVRIVGKVLGRVCSVDPAALLRAVTTAPLISSLFRLRYRELVPCNFGQPLIGISFFHVAKLRESLHQVTLTRNSQTELWCQILMDVIVANVLRTSCTLVAVRRHLDWITDSFLDRSR